MGRAMLSKSLIQFSVAGWGCVPSLLFDLRPNYGGADEDSGGLLQKAPRCSAALSAPALQQATVDTHLPWRLLDTQKQVWVSLLCGHCSFLLGPGAQGSVVPSKSLFPRLCKFWRLYGGVNGDFFQEGLCHTQVCCTQSPCPCSRPLFTHTFTVQFSSVTQSRPTLCNPWITAH